MTEAEINTALSDLGANAATFYTAFFSFTFAYLTAAYLIGEALTVFQAWLVSILFFIIATMFGATGWGYADAWLRLRARGPSILDEVFVFGVPGWSSALGLMTIASIFASLYFMLDIRRRARIK